MAAALARLLPDNRDPTKVVHGPHEMLARGVYRIARGYEDCNDADDLSHDPVLKASIERLPGSDPALASQPTLSRFEDRVSRAQLRRMAEVFVEASQRLNSSRTPRWTILDFDATETAW